MRNLLKTLLLTSLLVGCTSIKDMLKPTVMYTNECSWYETHKLSCNKEKLPEGSKCSEIISRDSQEWVFVMNQTYLQRCSKAPFQ